MVSRLIDVSKLMSRGCDSRARIGIGASGSLHALTSRRLSALGCDISLVRYSSADRLVGDLKKGRIDGAIRGTLGSGEMLRRIRSEFRMDRVMRTAILQSSQGKCFLLAPVGIDEGLTVDARLELVEQTCRYFAVVGWKPRIGVLSKGRAEDVSRGEEIRRSVEEGMLLTKMLKDRGYRASHNEILIEDALRLSEFIVAPDGVTGNLVFRSVHFVGGCSAYGAPVVNLDKVFVDTSRAKTDFSDAAMVAAGLVSAGANTAHRA